MIRPRIGDFVYNEMEIETMLEDIRMFKSEDVGGLVFGVLTAEHKVDVGRTSRYDLVYPSARRR